jgi:hypothetical protein
MREMATSNEVIGFRNFYASLDRRVVAMYRMPAHLNEPLDEDLAVAALFSSENARSLSARSCGKDARFMRSFKSRKTKWLGIEVSGNG